MALGTDSHRIFVFGANLKGRHGKGAALHAAEHYGAREGVGFGLHNQSYAIPTKGYQLEVLGLLVIARYVGYFVRDIKHYDDTGVKFEFNVSQIGCGLAGYEPTQIAPLFRPLTLTTGKPYPVWFDEAWKPYLGPAAQFWKAPI